VPKLLYHWSIGQGAVVAVVDIADTVELDIEMPFHSSYAIWLKVICPQKDAKFAGSIAYFASSKVLSTERPLSEMHFT